MANIFDMFGKGLEAVAGYCSSWEKDAINKLVKMNSNDFRRAYNNRENLGERQRYMLEEAAKKRKWRG